MSLSPGRRHGGGQAASRLGRRPASGAKVADSWPPALGPASRGPSRDREARGGSVRAPRATSTSMSSPACGDRQWRKWRTPVSRIAAPAASAAAMTSASRLLPPGCAKASPPTRHTLVRVGNGKKHRWLPRPSSVGACLVDRDPGAIERGSSACTHAPPGRPWPLDRVRGTCRHTRNRGRGPQLLLGRRPRADRAPGRLRSTETSASVARTAPPALRYSTPATGMPTMPGSSSSRRSVLRDRMASASVSKAQATTTSRNRPASRSASARSTTPLTATTPP